MMKYLVAIPTWTLVVLAVFLGLAPFFPRPHLVEKVGMLLDGTLTRPIDIFDLFFHSGPLILLTLKVILARKKSGSS